MREVKLRASSAADEMLQLWMKVYEAERQMGFSEAASRRHADEATSFQTRDGWLQIYAIARWEGLSESMSRKFSNAGGLEDDEARFEVGGLGVSNQSLANGRDGVDVAPSRPAEPTPLKEFQVQAAGHKSLDSLPKHRRKARPDSERKRPANQALPNRKSLERVLRGLAKRLRIAYH
jgi:hypothetical protein